MSRLLYRRTGAGPPDALFTSADGEVTEGWLAGAEDRPAEPARYVFADVVAAWCSTPGKPVREATVLKWHARYGDCPQAAAGLRPQARGMPRVAWAADSEPVFRAWRETLPGQGAPGKRKTPRRPVTDAERAELAAAWAAVPPAVPNGRDLESPEGRRARAVLVRLYEDHVPVADMAEVTGLHHTRVTQIVRAGGAPANRGRGGGPLGGAG